VRTSHQNAEILSSCKIRWCKFPGNAFCCNCSASAFKHFPFHYCSLTRKQKNHGFHRTKEFSDSTDEEIVKSIFMQKSGVHETKQIILERHEFREKCALLWHEIFAISAHINCKSRVLCVSLLMPGLFWPWTGQFLRSQTT